MRPSWRFAFYVKNLNRWESTSEPKTIRLIDISGGTFYRHYPLSSSTDSEKFPLFPNLTFHLPSYTKPNQHWAVLGSSTSARTAFFEILRSKHVCIPPVARTYPFLSTQEIRAKDPRLRSPGKAIQYVGFDAERRGLGCTSTQGAYLSARYESRKEETDFTLLDYLMGNTELNPAEGKSNMFDEVLLARVLTDLKLRALMDMPVSSLSNGQTRRARIAKVLMHKPELLLLDGPFMGLDPQTRLLLSSLLKQLAEAYNPRILLSLRPQDVIPDWTTHLVYVTEDFNVLMQGPKSVVLADLQNSGIILSGHSTTSQEAVLRSASLETVSVESPGRPLIEMQGVKIKYGSRCVLGDWHQVIEGTQKEGLWWTVRQGERWGIFGANGSGKTTLLSLITSDHPQTYSAPIRLFQRSRLPSPGSPGISIFDIQSRIGHSSPEVHAFFPRGISISRTLESAWADAPFSKPTGLSNDDRKKIHACLRWFQSELMPTSVAPDLSPGNDDTLSVSNLQTMYEWELKKCGSLQWANETRFGDISFSAQRVVLFLRAIIRNPEIVILDEAFSGLDETAKEKCSLFLSHGENVVLRKVVAESAEVQSIPSLQSRLGLVQIHGIQPSQALLVVSHLKEEIPDCVRQWITLPEPGTTTPRTGRLQYPLRAQPDAWSEIWGTHISS